MQTDVEWETVNWAAWEERYGERKPDPDWIDDKRIEILPTKSGRPTVRVRSTRGQAVYLHSSVNPDKEAERFAAGIEVEPGTVLIVNGLGLGYFVEALLAKVDEKVPLFIIEPDRELFYAAMKIKDLRPIITCSQVYIFVGDSENDVRTSFYYFFDAARYSDIRTIGLSGHQTVYSDFFRKISRLAWDALNVKLLNLVTVIKLGPDMMTNGILNLVKYYTHPGVNTLFNQFKDVPAIVVSAGPSLNKNIHLLKEAKGKALIIAVGTAVKALQKQGIEPDFIVTIDPHLLNYEHFKGVNTKDAALIVDLQAHHLILEDYQGPMFVAGDKTLLKWFGNSFEYKGYMESGGSVANSAFSMAYNMGANPIVLVGQDLAYGRDGHSHAHGTNYQDTVVSFSDEDLSAGPDFLKVKANDGGQVITNRSFYQFMYFFEHWIRSYSDRKYINATEGGAYIEGTQVATLREVVDQYCQNTVDIKTVIQECQTGFTCLSTKPFLSIIDKKIKTINSAIAQAQKALRHLKRLEKACENNNLERTQFYLNAITKIYDKFTKDAFLVNLPEWFSKHELHQVLYRTNRADLSDEDDFHAAIADYNIYYNKVCEASGKVKELLETCKAEAERRQENGGKSI